ncbi:MAG: hypothetical protein KGJ23_13880 [Euryarchaeota archaeon]|nr:hypothetical protein [Euryarchaeota archaeon]MDE1837687.1 hypothetical protein [Euryarchaeota archaeon]MDE1881795.1 hypothetical protein [Euryarchaeota archaeon]MDE2045983.1 hypothetical protein [Thermoplasmata archaeon]
MRVFLLGPSKWLPEARPGLPDYLVEWLPADWKRQGADILWPLDIRRGLAHELEKEGAMATMMELWSRRPTEDRHDLFRRILVEFGTEHVFAYWPRDANLSGLYIELGVLGEKVKNREVQGTSLRIFPELGAAFFDPDQDRVIFRESGARTTYSLDWEGWGVRISLWSDYRTLRQMMVSRLRTG